MAATSPSFQAGFFYEGSRADPEPANSWLLASNKPVYLHPTSGAIDVPEWTTRAPSSMKEISPSKNRNSLETDKDFSLQWLI